MDKLEQRQDSSDFDESDWVWGRAGIGKEINRTPNQVTYLLGQGLLDGAVRRAGHRTLIGSKRRLRELAFRLIDQS